MNISEYLRDVQQELTHVKWPTRRTTANFTAIVIALSIITAIYLGAFDFIFSEVVKTLI